MALLVRRKWWIVFPFLALSSAALLLTYILPRMYVSESLILIQPRDVPTDFVKDLIAGSTAQRLSAIEQTVLSRGNLVKIVQEFEGSIPEYQKMNLDDKITNLRNQIDLDFTSGASPGIEKLPAASFRISYRNRDPKVAQKIAAKVTSVFIDQDNQAREAKVSGTTSFLATELDKLSSQLNESDTRLRNLKGQRRYELPDQTPINLANLTRLEDQRKANLEAADRSQAQLTQLQAIIATTPAKLTRQQTPLIVAPPPARNLLVEDYLKTQAERSALIAKGLTEKHPDVETATRHLESLKKQIPPEVLAAALEPKDDKLAASQPTVVTEENPAYQNLKTTEALLINEIKLRRAAVADTETDIETYKKRVHNAPQSEQELSEIQRQNVDLNKRYQDLNDKLSQAQLSESLETRQQGSQFRIADPANLPLSPTKPVKSAIAAVGILISLLASMVIAVIADVANQKMWTTSEIEALMGASVLVEIPEIVTESDLREARRKRKIYVASLAALSAVYGACLYFVYLHQTFVLMQLEPVLKKLY